jgi:hypothetical protein
MSTLGLHAPLPRRRVIAYIDGFNLYYGLKTSEWQRYEQRQWNGNYTFSAALSTVRIREMANADSARERERHSEVEQPRSATAPESRSCRKFLLVTPVTCSENALPKGHESQRISGHNHRHRAESTT